MSPPDPVIRVEGLCKAFEIYSRPVDMFLELATGRSRHDLFWALRDVSFTVAEGSRVGIVGPNGAGKSTLLQVVSGTLQATSGTVSVHGKVSALLSLVPSWSLDETGIENVRFNLALQGTPPDRIPGMVEEICEFTELGAFLERPVRTYSSGMSARLAFAMATSVVPEILIVDEVLGAGDGYFAAKAAARMRDLARKGKALLFVSHSTAAVRQMCDRALWIENGAVRMQGDVDSVLARYEQDMLRHDEETRRSGNIRRAEAAARSPVPREIGDPDSVRVRLMPRGRARLAHSHYLKRMTVCEAGRPERQVPLVAAPDDPPGEGLDLGGSEWGRPYARRGVECRMLVPRPGSRPGGQVVLRRPPGRPESPWTFELEIELLPEPDPASGTEPLDLELLDLGSGAWVACPEVTGETGRAAGATDPEEWTIRRFRVAVGPTSASDRERSLARARQAVRPPAEILDAGILVAGNEVASVPEGVPFDLRIRVRYHEPAPASSVNLNVSRADGVYAFFLPSGLQGAEVRDFAGDADVVFGFDPNPFGAGEYHLGIFVCNGWSWDNVPPSEILARSTGEYRFRVDMATPIAFGLVNLRVPVRLDLRPSPGASDRGPAGPGEPA